MKSIPEVDDFTKSFPVAQVSFKGTDISYGVPNRVAHWRISTFATKEPETVKWLTTFECDDVFVDIGANMGLYSLFAAVYREARVYAFEPEAQNYALLNRNIELNDVADRVTAWCCALTNNTGVDRPYLSSTDAALSNHSYGAEVGPTLKARKAAFVQGSLGYTLDDRISSQAVPLPDHVKIDVDGIEHLVVAGVSNTFAQSKVKSVLIEINPHIDAHQTLIDQMKDLGFSYDKDQVERARRKEGATKDYAEYIFRR